MFRLWHIFTMCFSLVASRLHHTRPSDSTVIPRAVGNPIKHGPLDAQHTSSCKTAGCAAPLCSLYSLCGSKMCSNCYGIAAVQHVRSPSFVCLNVLRTSDHGSSSTAPRKPLNRPRKPLNGRSCRCLRPGGLVGPPRAWPKRSAERRPDRCTPGRSVPWPRRFRQPQSLRTRALALAAAACRPKPPKQRPTQCDPPQREAGRRSTLARTVEDSPSAQHLPRRALGLAMAAVASGAALLAYVQSAASSTGRHSLP